MFEALPDGMSVTPSRGWLLQMPQSGLCSVTEAVALAPSVSFRIDDYCSS